MSQQINLFNPVFLKQRKYFSLLTILQALGLVVLGSLFFYGYALYQVGQLKQQSEETTRRFNAEQARLVRYTEEFSPQQANLALQAEVRRLEQELAEQTRMVDTLKSGSVGNTTGYSQYMRAFSRQAVQGLWLTSFKVTGDAAQISLSGAVLNPELLPIYIQRLGREKAMQGKSFSTLQMQQPKTGPGNENQPAAAARYVEFTMHSTPDAEVKK
ncbi:MAG: fimbrial assembly protein [Gallionellales bacterium RIFCSPLOWO2_02_FULL_57_47]|nr:MAG: fimbrial assembly protein [Gallionellales bacterium RIFCSPLOWO2_02_FULL_57_47]OGT17114.1 MAG: fimbrial assembly protein [Gallionellales bacterium RIFCSPHIGHO2_02_FULL_57_16]